MAHKKLGVRVLTQSGRLHICQGSIVDFEGSCIVNAANEKGVGGGGVDMAVNMAGGIDFQEARFALPEVSPGVRIPKGTAVIMPASGNLKCAAVVHAVGPNYMKDGTLTECDALLRRAYVSAMALSLEHPTVGVCLLSSGIFRGQQSLDAVIRIALNTVIEWSSMYNQVYLIAFTDEERDALIRVCNEKFSGVDDDDVKE